MSVTEQRYKAVQGVLAEGRTVSEVAGDWGVCRRTMHRWLVRYEDEGLEGLGDHSHRPAHCPHQMPAAIEVMVLEMRRAHGYFDRHRSRRDVRAGCDGHLSAIHPKPSCPAPHHASLGGHLRCPRPRSRGHGSEESLV